MGVKKKWGKKKSGGKKKVGVKKSGGKKKVGLNKGIPFILCSLIEKQRNSL